jgi:hypothetical protein
LNPNPTLQLGIVWIKYETHDIAKMVVAKEDGNKDGIGIKGKEVKLELDAGERCRKFVKEELARRRNKTHPQKPSSPLAPPESNLSVHSLANSNNENARRSSHQRYFEPPNCLPSRHDQHRRQPLCST